MADPQSQIIAGRYAVGLTWRSIVTGGSTASLAVKRAREDHAGMFVHDGTSAFVGLAFLPKKAFPSKKSPAYALASMAAKAFLGEKLFALRLGEFSWWVGSVSNGTPGFDAFAESPEQVWELVELAKSRRKSGVEPELYADSALDLTDAQPLEVSQLAEFENADTLLRQTAPSLPKWVFLLALGLIALVAYSKGLPWWKARQEAKLAQNTPAGVDPVVAWTAATNVLLKEVEKPMGSDVSVLRSALYGLPREVGGWTLESVSCVASKQWLCTAGFKRPTVIYSAATNRTFENARPADWKINWKGSTEVAAAFEVIGTVSTPMVSATHVLSLTTFQVDSYSELQETGKAFSKVDVTPMVLLPVPAPKGPDGQLMPRPAQLPEIFKAAVTLNGPLRNIELVERTKAPIFWRVVTVNRKKADTPGLLGSEFNAVFQGDIYAKSR